MKSTRQMTRAPNEVGSTLSLPGYVFVLPWDLHHTGGVNQVVTSLHQEMLLAGEMEPLILVSEWSAFRPVETVVDARRTVHLRLWSPWTEGRPVLGLLKFIFFSPTWILDLLRFCRRHRVAAFNFHFPTLGAFPIALLRFLRLYRRALILSFHGTDLRNARRKGGVEGVLWRFILRNATAIVACSNALGTDAREFAGGAARRVHVVENGLDINDFLNKVDRTSKLPAVLLKREFILTVATWEWQKGLDVLLRAFAEVKRSDAEIALVLIGRAGDAEPDLRSLAIQLGVANDVLFIESVPNSHVGVYLERAKAFCLPSRAEAFGIVILEAGAYRLPVVASRVGGIPEIIIDGETGILTEPDDATELAAALGRVLRDTALARDLGDRLYHRVVDRFSLRRAYQEYSKLVP
jgi:glycosyltransferase involved in cell wall biosynthesis